MSLWLQALHNIKLNPETYARRGGLKGLANRLRSIAEQIEEDRPIDQFAALLGEEYSVMVISTGDGSRWEVRHRASLSRRLPFTFQKPATGADMGKLADLVRSALKECGQ